MFLAFRETITSTEIGHGTIQVVFIRPIAGGWARKAPTPVSLALTMSIDKSVRKNEEEGRYGTDVEVSSPVRKRVHFGDSVPGQYKGLKTREEGGRCVRRRNRSLRAEGSEDWEGALHVAQQINLYPP